MADGDDIATVLEEPVAPESPAPAADGASSRLALLRRPLVACAVLLAVYVALSFLIVPAHGGGTLGTDTGAKVATLRAMQDGHHALDPDVGYWAARWDPTGRLHPLYNTVRFGDRWVNVTTLPMLYAAYPLWRIGGYRAALLLPMLGAVLAALAARALARRLGATDGAAWWAFWLVGLASPMAVYALDLWEHTIGVALMAWAVVLLVDVVERRPRPWVRALGAGALFGAAATMRTEALVYGGVAVGIACVVVLVRDRRLVLPVVAGLAAVVGLAVPLLAGNALERATVGSSLRAERAAQTATAVVASGPNVEHQAGRGDETPTYAVGLFPSLDRKEQAVGAVLLVLLVVAASHAVRLGRRDTTDAGPLLLAGVGAVLLYVLRFADGLGFVPGLVAAAPLAAAGLAVAWRGGRAARVVAAIAVAALPLVWLTGYRGGAVPQWGARYTLVSGFLLVVCGAVALSRMARAGRILFVGLSVIVTAFGVAWLGQRTHDTDDLGRALAARPEPVLVSRVAHLGREVGSTYGDKRWLTAVTKSDERHAAAVVRDAGFDEFAVVRLDGNGPAAIDGFRRVGVHRAAWLHGVDVFVATYRTAS